MRIRAVCSVILLVLALARPSAGQTVVAGGQIPDLVLLQFFSRKAHGLSRSFEKQLAVPAVGELREAFEILAASDDGLLTGAALKNRLGVEMEGNDAAAVGREARLLRQSRQRVDLAPMRSAARRLDLTLAPPSGARSASGLFDGLKAGRELQAEPAAADPAERPAGGPRILFAESYRLGTEYETPGIQYGYLAYQHSWRVPRMKRLFLVLEPRLGGFVAPKTATLAVADLLFDWRFFSKGRFVAFMEGGGGLILSDDRYKLYGPINFDLVAGLGAHWLVSQTLALTVGYRLDHISNGGIYPPNIAVNSHMPAVGLTRFY